jgi:hypothetical protein
MINGGKLCLWNKQAFRNRWFHNATIDFCILIECELESSISIQMNLLSYVPEKLDIVSNVFFTILVITAHALAKLGLKYGARR